MEIEKAKLEQSPYIGVFAIITEERALLPLRTEKSEQKLFEKVLKVKAEKATIASSPLLGAFATGNSKGIVTSGLASKQEIKSLEKKDFNVLRLKSISAIGNILEINDEKGVCSQIISEKEKKDIEKFLGITIETQKIANTDLLGSCMVATNKGFIVNPSISQKEFEELEKNFGLEGNVSTANYGDELVGNSVVANSKGALVGELTSGHELIRIDEGLRGE